MNRKERTRQLRMGGYQGGIPLIKIRRSGVYVTEAKLRSNLFLADLPPGSPERATGKSAGGAELKRCPGGAFAEGESEAEAW